MKFKIAGLASTALLLLSPISGALTTIAKPSVVQAENNWDYDTANPGLGDYDKLLQNAGPSDGIVDWYPTKNALSTNPTGQELVKQLIELSIATNDANSNARNVLFNDTTGVNDHEGYQETYDKYPLAFGFIAQLLEFNNEKTGLGAQLAQGAEPGDNDPLDPRNDQSVINQAVQAQPKAGQGHTIADVLGKAFFGNADDAYAQIYLNGYDNVAQNEANIIRESTSSITIVAVSKLTGRKATAIFKLNNKTLPRDVANTKLNNYVDQSSYAQDTNDTDIAGLNMTTASQSKIDHLPLTKEASYWVSNKDGGGTIVVPRGTTAQQIAALIAKKQVEGNNTLAGSAPMKAIQAAAIPETPEGKREIIGKGLNKTWGEVSYSHFYEGTQSNEYGGGPYQTTKANGYNISLSDTPLYKQEYNFANLIAYGVNGPENFNPVKNKKQFREYNNVFNTEEGAQNGNPIKLTGKRGKASWFGGNDQMIDTNELFSDGKFVNKSASSLPDYNQSEGTPFDDHILDNAINTDDITSSVAGTDDPSKGTSVGKVKHLFTPSSYFKEAYDANHFVNNSPQIQDKDVAVLASQLANNGSFSNTSTDGQIKKSFTYEAPVSSWLYKSYNNPYSTVMSSAGAQTVDGKTLATNRSNSTIQPQENLDLNNPNNPDPRENITSLENNTYVREITNHAELRNNNNSIISLAPNYKIYFYAGIFPKTTTTLGSNSDGQLEIKFNDGVQGTIAIKPGTAGTLVKYGAIGTDGENKVISTAEIGGENLISSGNISSTSFSSNEINPAAYYNMNIKNSYTTPTPPSLEVNSSESESKFKIWDDSQYFVQTWDKNTRVKKLDGTFESNPAPLIYNSNLAASNENLGNVDSPNFESKYYLTGYFIFEPSGSEYTIKAYSLNDHIVQTAASKRAYFNSNLYNNPKGAFSTTGSNTNNSRFFVSQDFAIGPVSSDMISDAGPQGSEITIDGEYYPYGKNDSTNGKTPEENAAQILKLAVMYNNPEGNSANGSAKAKFTEAAGYKLVSIGDAASKQGVSEATLAEEVAKVTGKSAREVKNTKWVEATLPRLKRNAGKARINVVVYDQDKTAISTPTKAETKPSFSTTDVSTGNDPFNVNLRPYTTTYDDGAVLKGADVPQSFQNLLSNTLVAGNADLVEHPNRLEQVLVSAFLNSWQQNDGSFDQTDTGVGVNSPLYLYGGFGISNSDTKNSYSQWPNGYTTNTGDYLTATSHYSGDFYRGGKDLQLVRGGTVKGIPASALKADVSKVDLSKAGTYPVVYTYTNPSNAKDSASITVPVTVKDAVAPVFAFQGGSDLTIRVGDSFDRNAYKVVGNWQIFNKYEGDYNKLVSGEGIATGSDGKPQVTITGDVDTHTPGVYQVTYEATNLSGIKAKMVRKINVLPQETGNNPDKSDWTVSVMKGVGYINYMPGYGVNVWNAPAGTFTGQRLNHGTSWKIFQKAVNRQGKVYYNVGKNQWLDGAYVSFTPVSALQPLNGIVTINYVPGYGVNLWKAPEATGGYYEGRKLPHGTKWKVFGVQDGFYKVGGNQWIQAKYAKFQAR